ncbi:CHAD domain-containing protein [Breznakibacter xylanolyticus]|uniref:CHAD domain-containing protein n=1 Tax=Breznakibacter xylanolyticus TaxID=990 RepID=A0A2W7NEI3_9BACT|nr:CHAD domain-containing protein [Breznakibacter xylanolyticus]PZX18598.1 CHAD domain-containing protein [Breznakibacter xylanolyticus]
MPDSSYISFIVDASRRFSHHVIKAADGADDQSVHDFRVAAKELDAFYCPLMNVAETSQGQRMTQWRSHLFKIYKPAGKYRNAFMIHKLGKQVKVWDHLPCAEVRLLTRMQHLKAQFISELASYQPPRFNKIHSLLKHLEPLLSAEIDNVIHQNFVKAHPLMVLPAGMHWHDARRCFKKNHFLLRARLRIGANVNDDEMVVLTDLLEKELGHWHDWALLLHFLNPELKHSPEVATLIHARVFENEQAILRYFGVYKMKQDVMT